jgi:replication factor C large subunit
MWVEKYRPTSPSQLVGNEASREALYKWLADWKPGSKPALLIGPPGVGKTTAVHATSTRLGFTVIELNASDARTEQKLERYVGPTLSSGDVLGGKLLLLLDEVDGIYGRADMGAMEFILDKLVGAPLPVAFTANRKDDPRLQKISGKSVVFTFKPIPPRLVEVYLRQISKREGLTIKEDASAAIAMRSHGDMRVAINSLQGLQLQKTTPNLDVLAEKTSEQTAAANLLSFLHAEDPDEAFAYIRNVRVEPREKMALIYHSVVNSEISTEERAEVLSSLAKIDVLVGRIYRKQTWRLLRHLDRMLSTILHGVHSKEKLVFNSDSLPFPLKLRIWNDRRVLIDLNRKMAQHLNISARQMTREQLPYTLLQLSRLKQPKASQLTQSLGLEESALRIIGKETEMIKERIGV